MSWRSWTSTNPCPVCSGYQWAGRSADQCRGGQREESPIIVYCSVKESSERCEKTWKWVGTEPYAWLPEAVESDPTPIWQRAPSRAPSELRGPGWALARVWEYEDEHGNYAYSVCRFDFDRYSELLCSKLGTDGHYGVGNSCAECAGTGYIQPPAGMRTKDYRPGRRFAPGSDLYRWGLPAEARLPYRLPELLLNLQEGAPVWIVEGEKSCDALYDLGTCATTMPGGSASWLIGEPSRWLPPELEAHVVVDRDAAGLAWARDVRTTLPHATFWQSATLDPGDDVVDHLAAGFPLAELIPLEMS